ncbi:hypothetical protein C1H46_045034 [Malus baccata]|uniref:Uncharacterized protein n=1 Tax=Malus baccata TaxID=106549 RepID=A0A540K5D9_MALBA|nr:hypothetical protein C1H46_045034 [Malus baccata]
MAPPSRTWASVTVEGSRTTNRSGHTYKHLTCFLTSIPSVAMKRKPKSGVLSYRQSKNSFNFSSSSVGSSLRPYFRTDGIVHTVLIHDVTSRLKGRSQSSCTDSRVVQLLGKPTAAMAKLSPKADILQIAHPIHPPKEPNKVRLRQSEIYEDKDNLRKVVLPALGGPTVPGTTVFSPFYGRLKKIHESHRKHPVVRVVDANEENEILFKEDPQIEFSEEEAFGRYLDLHEIYNQYINSKFGEPIEYSAYLANISQPQQLPRTLKSSRQYRACMETLLAYLIYFFQRTEPLQHLDRIFLKVETEFEESWADGNVKGWENEKQETGHVQDQLTMINLDYYSTVEELMEVGPEKLKVALASLGLKTGGTVPHAVETILGYLITLLIGTFAGLRLCSMDIFLKLIGKAPKWEFTGRGSMIGSTIWYNNLVLLTNVCLLVFRGNTCVTRSLIRLSEQSATLTWPTEGHFGQEAGVFAAFIRGHIPDPLQIMAESLFLIFQELISMVLSLAVGPEQIGCSSFSPNLAAIENFYWMLILPKLQSPHATEHPMLMDNALKFFIAIWNTTLETMILQFSLTLPPFLSAESPVVHSFAINDLDQSHQSKHNILLEQFGARKASLGLAYFNFHDNGITALLLFNPAISFLSSYFPYVHRGHILLWRLSASYKPYMLWMFQAAMSSTGTWCFELIIKVVRSVGVQLDHIIYNHAILGLGTAKSLEQNCTVMYGVLSHFGNVHGIKTWAMLFADHSFMVKDLSRLAKLLQYCVADAHLSDASLLNPRMQDYYSINTKVVDTYLQNVSRYKLKIILGLCSVALHASGSLRPKFFGYITFLDFWKLVCLWNASRFGNLAYSPRVYAGTYSATEVQFARIELVLQCFLLYPLPTMIFGLSTFVTPKARLNTILRDVCFIAPALLQRSCMVEAQLGRLGSKFCLEANVFVVCLAIHTALVLEASIMILFWNPKALGEQATQASTCQLDGMRTCLILTGREC